MEQLRDAGRHVTLRALAGTGGYERAAAMKRYVAATNRRAHAYLMSVAADREVAEAVKAARLVGVHLDEAETSTPYDAPQRTLAALSDRMPAAVYIEPVSDREREVLNYLATHLPLGAIAEALFISKNTLKTHVKTIYRKLDVTSRHAAVMRALSMGMFEPTEAEDEGPPRFLAPAAVQR